MDATEIAAVSTAVVLLTQYVKWAGLPDTRGPLVVLALSLLGVALWGYSVGTFERTKLFGYFAGWLVVSASAAGVFGFTRSSPAAVTLAKAPPAGGAGSDPVEKP